MFVDVKTSMGSRGGKEKNKREVRPSHTQKKGMTRAFGRVGLEAVSRAVMT
jgi:hypothetical protein